MSAEHDAEAIEPELDAGNAAERRTVKWVLGINATQVVVAGAVGIASKSTGLLGAALGRNGSRTPRCCRSPTRRR